MSVAWCHERLDQACDRISREASSKADRILAEMDDYRTRDWRCDRAAYSAWHVRRVIFPRIMADLDAL